MNHLEMDSLQRFGRLELGREEAEKLSTAAIVDRLIAIGTSRLTAERIVAIERGGAEPGRARNHGLRR